jgi:hypothetical protein
MTKPVSTARHLQAVPTNEGDAGPAEGSAAPTQEAPLVEPELQAQIWSAPAFSDDEKAGMIEFLQARRAGVQSAEMVSAVPLRLVDPGTVV